jgi:hypothetical protein
LAVQPPERIGLVGCVKAKASVARPAADLYTSTLFRGRSAYVARSCQRWLILSALHGVVNPDVVLEPYDVSLVGASRDHCRVWSRMVLDQLCERLGDLGAYDFEIHAGAPYREFGLVEGLHAAGATVTNPAEGLGIGKQLAFYRRAGDRPKDARSGLPS